MAFRNATCAPRGGSGVSVRERNLLSAEETLALRQMSGSFVWRSSKKRSENLDRDDENLDENLAPQPLVCHHFAAIHVQTMLRARGGGGAAQAQEEEAGVQAEGGGAEAASRGAGERRRVRRRNRRRGRMRRAASRRRTASSISLVNRANDTIPARRVTSGVSGFQSRSHEFL